MGEPLSKSPRLIVTAIAAAPLPQGHSYAMVNPRQHIPEMMKQFWRHALLVWIIFPSFATTQAWVPLLHPTCEAGYPASTLVVVGLVTLHHIFAEMQAWDAANGLLTRPERTVMRQLGVLGKRKSLAILGLLEDLDVCASLTFPSITIGCDVTVTERWFQAWNDVPVIGASIAPLIQVVGFTGCALALALLTTTIGATSLLRMAGRSHFDVQSNVAPDPEEAPRTTGHEFTTLASAAETALMPSVALLCNEMARQKAWILDASQDAGDKGVGAHGELSRRRLSREQAEMLQFHDEAEREAVEEVQRLHHSCLLLFAVCFCNVPSIWLQSSFFALSFEGTGFEAKCKLLASIVLSLSIALARCRIAATKVPCMGVPLLLLLLGFVVWIAAKLYHAYTCEGHVWNVSSGCVALA